MREEQLHQQIGQEMERAGKALQAAQLLFNEELYEDSVSRAYYAVLHAARAALLKVPVQPESHAAVRRLFGLHLVKAGRIEAEFATILTAEKEDREMGDYGIGLVFPVERSRTRLDEARRFLQRVEQFLSETN